MHVDHASTIALAPEAVNSRLLAVEQEFYGSYDWCLNAYPTIENAMRHLDRELSRYLTAEADWHREEIARNVYLLACAILDTTDDYLLGRRYGFSKVLGVFPNLSPLTRMAQSVLHTANGRYWLAHRRVQRWRGKWEAATIAVLRTVLLGETIRPSVTTAVAEMRRLLAIPLPSAMRMRRPRIPAAFRSQDLTHFDVLSLGNKLIAACPDRTRPVLVTGLRTAGSYFALLLRAQLESQGYRQVRCVTLRPKAGVSRWEKARISQSAAQNCLAAIIDEPVGTGGTLGKGVALLTKHGVAMNNIVVLFPVHQNGRGWRSNPDAEPICACRLLTLEHDEWYKHRLIDSSAVETLLREYFGARGWEAQLDESGAEQANAHLTAISEEKYHTRLKRVFSVRLSRAGETTRQYVLAKSVGWGWLGYHAFLAGTRLTGSVPPVLGLRDGILYSKWITEPKHKPVDSAAVIRTVAQYVGARALALRFNSDRELDVMRDSQPARGIEELAGRLSGAYGKAGGILKRARMKRDLAAMQSHQPALIDGRMRRVEWIPVNGTMLKCDFEQHGIGKHQLNLTDPAYDLAEAILFWNLTPAEESDLMDEYVAVTGDRNVHGRMLLHKLLAGTWSMDRALENLNDKRMVTRHNEFNRQYLDAWNFLVLHTMRFCAGLCPKPAQVGWGSPLAVLDVDGVIDKQVFGFPSTTMAGIQAISMLHAHGFTVALNTARSIPEVKEYCRAYGFAGGIAEYGAHIWDAVSDEERVLVSSNSLAKLEHVREALRRIPGVFLNDDYRYSIKACTYEHGRSVAVPKIVVQDLIAGLGLDGLSIHPTYTDTTILCNETDKGRGLVELLRLSGMEGAETYAVGDSAPDLSMFRMATHSFAPGHISCAAAARLLRCKVASRSYQPGLLESVRAMVQNVTRSQYYPSFKSVRSAPEQYFVDLLSIADRSTVGSLVRALLDPMSLQTFVAE